VIQIKPAVKAKNSIPLALMLVGVATATPDFTLAAGSNTLDVAEARALAERVTVFGFPLVEHYKAMWGANSPQSPYRPKPYSYAFAAKRYTWEDRVVVAPNNDTIYAGCALDLRTEPTVLIVPAVTNRYYGIQFIGVDTCDFAYVGVRATGTGSGTYLIAGPDWKGSPPPGITQVLRSPSQFALAPLRIGVSSDADLVEALKLDGQFKLMPLSTYLKQPAPPPSPDVKWPPYYDARAGNLEGFLRTLAFVMRWQVFTAADQPALAELERLGVVAGNSFTPSAFAPDIWAALEAGFNSGRESIAKQADQIGPVVNSWGLSLRNAGNYGTDYLTRAAAAWKYIYVQSAEEAMYPTADVDAEGRPLDGLTGRYLIEFPPGKTPPVRFFWSLTLYDRKNGWMVKNPIARYSIGDRTDGFQPDADGVTRIYIQAESPGAAKEANWLPAPRERFYMTLRLYGPKAQALEGQWTPPPVQSVK